jgi:formylglycine-generating enzyme required for sulfatase activity
MRIGLLALCLFPSVASAVAIDWTLVGDPGNACEVQPQGCFGDVAYFYQIGRYEVTNTEYAAFLNSVAAADPNTLYHTNMASSGITRSGSSGSFTYTAIAGRASMPVGNVSFYDTLRFANWLHNGQPLGAQGPTTTEGGAYTFSGPTTVGTRNAGASVFLPSEDEWYKAAYDDDVGSGYFDYPAGSDAQTVCAAPTATPNRQNCDFAVNDTTDVGSYPASASPHGTFDQGGNVIEWNEAVIGANRGARGGYFQSDATLAAAAARFDSVSTFESPVLGFRVAPEPGVASQLAAGAAALWILSRRTPRTRQAAANPPRTP